MKGLEEARQRYKPTESQASQPLRDEATSLPLAIQASARRSIIRRSKVSARALASETPINIATSVNDFVQS
jgi:hypothetical protein